MMKSFMPPYFFKNRKMRRELMHNIEIPKIPGISKEDLKKIRRLIKRFLKRNKKLPHIPGVSWDKFDLNKIFSFKPFKHGSIVVGAMFGDEGKGKAVDTLASLYKALGYKVLSIRGQGSGNAGHTIEVDDVKYDFHYLTSAGFSAAIMLLGPGMLIDPIRLLEEMKKLPSEKRDIVMVAERAAIVSNLERVFDAWCEAKRSGSNKIGTTGSGVGPGAGIRGFRFHVTFADALKCNSAKELRELFLSNPIIPYDVINKEEKVVEGGEELTRLVFSPEYVEELWQAIHQLKIVDSVEVTNRCRQDGDWAVILEVSQAVGLDPLFGNGGHFCTSTPCTDVGGIAGCGLTIHDFPEGTFLMCKAYTSKVGGGPFIVKFTEAEKTIDTLIHEIVGEKGVTTGRNRDLGWFDGPLVRRAIALTGGKICINCMDVIAELSQVTNHVKVCYAYRHKKTGEITYEWPYHLADYEPLFITMDISQMSKEEIIRNYILLLESVLGQKIHQYGVGPKREDFLPRRAAFVA